MHLYDLQGFLEEFEYIAKEKKRYFNNDLEISSDESDAKIFDKKLIGV